MRGRSSRRYLAIGVACVVLSGVLVISALAASGGDVAIEEGPVIDYCPTTEQIEAHLEEYGFDYKPSVVCGENGDEVVDATEGEDPADVSYASQKEAIKTATRAPDADGDPLTVELVLTDGTKKTLQIFGDPKFIENLSPAELAEVLYPKDKG